MKQNDIRQNCLPRVTITRLSCVTYTKYSYASLEVMLNSTNYIDSFMLCVHEKKCYFYWDERMTLTSDEIKRTYARRSEKVSIPETDDDDDD